MTKAARFAAMLALAGFGLTAEEPRVPVSDDDRLFEKLLGDDPEPPERDRSDPNDAVAPSVPAEPPAAVDPEAVGRIEEHLHKAERLLAGGTAGEPTRVAQRAVIDELSRLIEAAKRASASSPASEQGADGRQTQPEGSGSPDTRPGEGEASPGPAEGQPNGPPDRNRDGKAEESSDRLPERATHDLIRDFRSDLVRDAWGHLPPRLREQLLNSRSDQYLPRYDGLVRRYFESLAQPDPPKP